MRKSTLVFSFTLIALCVCILVYIMNITRKSVRHHADLSQLTDSSRPQSLAEFSNTLQKINQATTLTAPKLRLDIATHMESDKAQPNAVSDAVSGRVGILDSVLSSEIPDPIWTSDVTNALHDAYTGLMNVKVGTVNCGQSMCRLELLRKTEGDASLEEAKAGIDKVKTITGELSFRVSAPPTEPKVVIYMARANTRLPRLKSGWR